MKWRIDDVPIFAAIVEQNGVSSGANQLGISKSTASSALARLEQALGFRLFVRNSRMMRLTPDGQTFYRQALLILEQVREADATVAGLSAEPAGRLSVALPPAFAQEIVAPRLAAFYDQFPKMELDIVVTAHGVDLIRDQLDLAVVVGPLRDSDLISRTLFSGPLVWVASPDYLARHRIGQTVDAIRSHVRICEARYGQAKMPVHVDGVATQIDLATGITHVNDPLVVRQTLINGGGVSPLPELYCRKPIAEGTLVALGQNVSFDLSASVLSVVYPHRMLVSPRLRVFLDFLSVVSK